MLLVLVEAHALFRIDLHQIVLVSLCMDFELARVVLDSKRSKQVSLNIQTDRLESFVYREHRLSHDFSRVNSSLGRCGPEVDLVRVEVLAEEPSID